MQPLNHVFPSKLARVHRADTQRQIIHSLINSLSWETCQECKCLRKISCNRGEVMHTKCLLLHSCSLKSPLRKSKYVFKSAVLRLFGSLVERGGEWMTKQKAVWSEMMLNYCNLCKEPKQVETQRCHRSRAGSFFKYEPPQFILCTLLFVKVVFSFVHRHKKDFSNPAL